MSWGGVTLVQCLACANVYGISDEDAVLLVQADDSVGKTIDESLPCPVCEYDLRTLSVGHKCPECGTQIPGRKALSVARANRQRRPWAWGWLILGMGLLAIGLIPTLRRPEAWLCVVGIGATGYGVKGLATRAIAPNVKTGSPVVHGAKALFWSLIYVLGGLSLIVLAALILLGVVR